MNDPNNLLDRSAAKLTPALPITDKLLEIAGRFPGVCNTPLIEKTIAECERTLHADAGHLCL